MEPAEEDSYLLQATTDHLGLKDAGITTDQYAQTLRVLYRDETLHGAQLISMLGTDRPTVERIFRYLELHEEVAVDYGHGQAWHLPHTALQLCRLYRIHPGEAHDHRDDWDEMRRDLLPDLDGSLRGTGLKTHLTTYGESWNERLDHKLVRLFVALCVIESAMEESVSAVRYDLSKVRDIEKEMETRGQD